MRDIYVYGVDVDVGGDDWIDCGIIFYVVAYYKVLRWNVFYFGVFTK